MKSRNRSPRISDPCAEVSTESSSDVNRSNDSSGVQSVHKSQQMPAVTSTKRPNAIQNIRLNESGDLC